MKDYRGLANAYLRAGRARSIITVVGVALTVMVLYGGLNFAYSYLLYAREQVRSEKDYEFVLMTDSEEQAQQIAADDRIEKAYTGAYEYAEWMTLDEYKERYGKDYEETTTVYDEYGRATVEIDEDSDYAEVTHVAEHALYATGKNPYHMEETMNELSAEYDVYAEINGELAGYYMQDDDTGVFLMVIVILLAAYIFAIFAVGIIRNTVQMFMLEQVKDYGILRCVGATKKQLGGIIYRMGLYLELAGIVAGVLLGGAVSALMGLTLSTSGQMDISAGYHMLPILPVLVAYLGDLFFVMKECSKLVMRMTPIEAVRGEFRIRKERIKVRGRGLMGRLFGIEGEYARKSAMRNHGRLAKTIFGVSISIAVIVLVLSSANTTNVIMKKMDSQAGKYQFRVEYTPSVYESIDYVESQLPSTAELEKVLADDSVLQAKKIYSAVVMTSDIEGLYDKYTDEYLSGTYEGQQAVTFMTALQEYRESTGETGETNQDSDSPGAANADSISDTETWARYAKASLPNLVFEGLDADDLDSLSEYLLDGTTDVSEDGIVIVVARSVIDPDGESMRMYDDTKHINCLDYKVGDTIDIVDTELLYSRAYEALTEAGWYDSDSGMDGRDIINDIYDELVNEGKVRTYTVEGIVDMGDEVSDFSYPVAYTSISNYLAETGFDESQISGMKYQMDTKSITSPSNFFSEDAYASNLMSGVNTDSIISSEYSTNVRIIATVRNVAGYAVAVVVFIFSLSAVNIINTTAGSLHMRRREFAQLRVIGMSKKRLIRTVMLEGVMTVILSNVIGALIGTAAYAGECYYLNMLLKVEFTPSVTAILVGLIVSAALIFGSIYFPLRSLPQSMAVDLSLEE